MTDDLREQRAREVLRRTRHSDDCELRLDLGPRTNLCSCDHDIRAMLAFAAEADEPMVRITKQQYPEIIQAARWSDEDNGTDHFEPGIGFVIDDPDGLNVPKRWEAHLPVIEAALAGLDHTQPHPLDVDTIEYLEREGKAPSVDYSAACCFVRGEYAPQKAMAESSEALWIASRFLNEYFEGGHFDPAAGFATLRNLPASEMGEAFPDIGALHPMQMDPEERAKRDDRLRAAFSVQQKGVPDQTALVWRADLIDWWHELVRSRARLENLSTPHASAPVGDEVELSISNIVRDVAELPDRSSPDDWPEAMLVTGEELAIIVERHFRAAISAIHSSGDGWKAEAERQEGLAKIYRQAQLTAEQKLCRAEADAKGHRNRCEYLEGELKKLRATTTRGEA